jgi:hypothetical protein
MGRGGNNGGISYSNHSINRSIARSGSVSEPESSELPVTDIEQAKYLYHATNKQYKQSIEEQGILADSGFHGLTEDGHWAEEYYQGKPVYLSLNPGRSKAVNYLQQEQTVFRVDHSKLNLLPDLPGLIDHQGIIDQQGIYWEENQEPEQLLPFLDEGYISFDDLLSDQQACQAAINTTLTAAVIDDISADLIEQEITL